MILTGLEIAKQYGLGAITIDPWNPDQLGPNSYNVRLAPELWTYPQMLPPPNNIISAGKELGLVRVESKAYQDGRDWYYLTPGTLYLGRTVEHTETHGFVPMLEGRSSIGRLGLFIHVTAGFGDIGFKGFWTLELSVVQPLWIPAGIEIGQLYYHTVQGDIAEYRGKYQANQGVQGSQLWKELQG